MEDSRGHQGHVFYTAIEAHKVPVEGGKGHQGHVFYTAIEAHKVQ